MDSSPMVRINAIEAIMNSDDEDAVELLKPCLNDDDDEVKKNALIAIYNLIGRDILDEVIDLPIYTEYLKNEAKELIFEYEEGELLYKYCVSVNDFVIWRLRFYCGSSIF